MYLGKEYLENLPLGDLRKIGREIGVKAPTALKKNQLINAILEVISGEVPPCHNLNNRGRPKCKEELSVSAKAPISIDKLARIEQAINDCSKQIMEILSE